MLVGKIHLAGKKNTQSITRYFIFGIGFFDIILSLDTGPRGWTVSSHSFPTEFLILSQ